MTKVDTIFNAISLSSGFIGAVIFWHVGRREGSGLPFYADSKGKIIADIAAENKKRQSRKNIGMLLIAVGFFGQLFALFL